MSQSSKGIDGRARYELRFSSLSDDGVSYAFPCDAGGQVDMAVLSERTRNNYFYARAVVGRVFSFPSIALVA